MKCIIPFQRIETDHICCMLVINGQQGFFLIDTGASNSCIAKSRQRFYGLIADEDPIEAASAGSERLEAQKMQKVLWEDTQGNVLGWFPIMLLNLESINDALAKQGAPAIEGILGADVLSQLEAQINYATMKLSLQL